MTFNSASADITDEECQELVPHEGGYGRESKQQSQLRLSTIICRHYNLTNFDGYRLHVAAGHTHPKHTYTTYTHTHTHTTHTHTHTHTNTQLHTQLHTTTHTMHTHTHTHTPSTGGN